MWRFIVYVSAFVIMVIINYLANSIPLNGQTTGEISSKVTVLFTPASYVFSIWGLIYFSLAIWIIRMLPGSRRHLPMYEKALFPFIFSCLLNVFWIFSWHYEFFISSVFLMIALLLILIRLYQTVKNANASFFDLFPFSLYLGWISVATIANISFTLEFYDWSGWGLSDVTWTIVMLCVATALALIFSKRQRDVVYPLVFVWAFVGIGVKNQGIEQGLANTAFILAAVILIGVGYLLGKKA